MLRIYDLVLQIVRALRPFLELLVQHDADLARQMRRALASVPLNVAEGSSSRGGNRAARYHSAAGSMQEVIACVDVAIALGYVESFDSVLLDQLHKVVATLKKVAL
jgi:four helix bundle protein